MNRQFEAEITHERRQANELVSVMLGEVQRQLKRAVTSFLKKDERLARTVIEHDDFIDNLYLATETRLYEMIGQCESDVSCLPLRAAQKIAKGLEKIADFAENIAKQALHFCGQESVNLPYDLVHFHEEAKAGIDMAVRGFLLEDLELIKAAALKEAVLDGMYQECIDETLAYLDQGGDSPRGAITQLFASKHFERIGDIVLDISEEVLTLISGERLKIRQYNQINQLLKDSNSSQLVMEGIWGTRSGSNIFKLEDGNDRQFIYKEGNSQKIRLEADKLKKWNAINPGLVPKVIATRSCDDHRILMTEFIEGPTLQDIYTRPDWELKEQVTYQLTDVVGRIWEDTFREIKTPFNPVRQLRKRLNSVFSVHPGFKRFYQSRTTISGLTYPSLDDMLDRIELRARDLRSPFSVYLHGDFNSDNIICAGENDCALKFIDVHRSHIGDYLQDVSVFIVSNLRIPALSEHQYKDAERIRRIIERQARAFAKQHGDTHFDIRLHIFLARSLITSTRFIYSFSQAKRLFMSGVQRLEYAYQALGE